MNARLALLLIAASLALSACGNKGSLVLPDKLDETAVPATPATPVDATSTDAPTTSKTPPEAIDAPAEEVTPVPPPDDDD